MTNPQPSSKLRELLDSTNRSEEFQHQIRKPVTISLSRSEIERYMKSEHDPRLVRAWAEALVERWNNNET
jgi:hypothetical protein